MGGTTGPAHPSAAKPGEIKPHLAHLQSPQSKQQAAKRPPHLIIKVPAWIMMLPIKVAICAAVTVRSMNVLRVVTSDRPRVPNPETGVIVTADAGFLQSKHKVRPFVTLPEIG